MKTLILLFTAAIFITLGSQQQATAQQQTGKEIIEKTYHRPIGDDQEADLEMTLINARGDTRERSIKQFTKDLDDVEKSIMFFTAPADVANTSFMNWSYEDGSSDDQWIYLPSLRRVRRISSDDKSDRFMGSDFTYDDLGDRHPDDDEHELLREETINGKECYVVESTPKNPDYMYSRTVTWIEKDTYIGVQKEFYDEYGDFLKTLTVNEYENIDGFDIITHTEMYDDQRDHRTVMEMKNVKVNTGISDNMFTERMMSRGL